MRIAAGASRVEARDFVEGTAVNPSVHGSSYVGQVAVYDALHLHDGSIGLEVKGLDPHRSELGEVVIQLGLAQEHLRTEHALRLSQCEQPQSCNPLRKS